MRALVCLLAVVVASQGASLTPIDLVDNLQELLANPEALGVRVKRNTEGPWDKELDLGIVGLSFRIKYTDPNNLMKGGRAHITFPGQKFFHGLHFDDVELDIHFNGGNHIDGLFDMKIDYKYVQKFTFLADRPQAGKIILHRKLEGGMWKTKMAIDNINRQPSPFFDVDIESDRMTKLYGTFRFDDDNKWEMKIDRVPGSSITGVFIINGVQYKIISNLDTAAKKVSVQLMGHDGHTHQLELRMTTGAEYGFLATGDVYGPVNVKMVIMKDMKKIDFVVKHNNINYAYVKLNGEAVMAGVLPQKVDYIMKYNIMDSEWEGKAKVNFNGQAATKTIKMSFVPTGGQDLTIDFKWTTPNMRGYRIDFQSTRSGVTLTKIHHEIDMINNANKFEVDMKGDINMDPMSVFYNFFCWKVGRCFTHGTRNTKMMYHKNDKNFLLGKMKFEDKSMVDGQKLQEKKLDTTKTPYTLMWYQPIGPINTRDLFNLDQVEVKAWHTIGQELKIETNIEDMKLTIRRTPHYFIEFIRNGETMVKAMTEITPAMFTANIDTLFYLPSTTIIHKMFCLYGKGCFNKRQGHMKIVIDRANKNALLNKFSIESTIVKDDKMALEMSVSTMNAPYTFHINAPYFLPRFFSDMTRKTIEGTITHQMGNKLEIHTNCPEFENFAVTTNGNHRTVMLNGRELTVVDYTTGQKRISQTMELPSGEHLTTTVEWTRDTMKTNEATVTIQITPDRRFNGIFSWDFQTVKMGNMRFDMRGRNPWLGEYSINRKANWNLAAPQYIFGWVGKSEFSTGILSTFSPIDSKFEFNYDMRRGMLNADIFETLGGKKWGMKVARNRFSLLTGIAA